MDKMMADMAIKPTGDVDLDFVAMMIPHHQGAIDMALAVLRYGKNEQIRRLAQEIIVEQQQEIVAMRLAVGQPLLPPLASPTQPGSAPAASSAAHDHTAMSMPASPEAEIGVANHGKQCFWLRSSSALSYLVRSPAYSRAGAVRRLRPGHPAQSSRDRVYAAEQFSNTVSVTDPAANKLLGVIRLGDPQPGNFSPLYKGQVLVHGMGFSPDRQDDRRRLDRLEFRDLHRHRDQYGEAHHLCRPLAA